MLFVCLTCFYMKNTLIFPGVYKTAPTESKLSDGTIKSIERTKPIHPIYCDQFAWRDMSFEFAEAVLLQFLKKKDRPC